MKEPLLAKGTKRRNSEPGREQAGKRHRATTDTDQDRAMATGLITQPDRTTRNYRSVADESHPTGFLDLSYDVRLMIYECFMDQAYYPILEPRTGFWYEDCPALVELAQTCRVIETEVGDSMRLRVFNKPTLLLSMNGDNDIRRSIIKTILLGHAQESKDRSVRPSPYRRRARMRCPLALGSFLRVVGGMRHRATSIFPLQASARRFYHIALFRLRHTSTLHIRILVLSKFDTKKLIDYLLSSLRPDLKPLLRGSIPCKHQLVVVSTSSVIQDLAKAEVAGFIDRQTRNFEDPPGVIAEKVAILSALSWDLASDQECQLAKSMTLRMW